MSRRERLEQLAELALDLGLALVKTGTFDPAWCPVSKDDPHYALFKAPHGREWQKTTPVERERNAYRGELAAYGEPGNGKARNFLVNLRGSRLFGFEVDGGENLERFLALRRELGLPQASLVVQSGGGADRLHLYYRLAVEDPEKVSLRFEGGSIKAATNNAFVAGGSLHPSGTEYLWLALPRSREEMTEISAGQYHALLERAGAAAREVHAQIQSGAVIEDGNRGDALFKHAVDLVHWGHSEDEIVALLDAWQGGRFRNPHALEEVRRQVRGAFAWQRTGGAKTLAEFASVDVASAVAPALVHDEDGRPSYGGLTVRRASEVPRRAQPWLVKGKVVADNINLLAGVGGLGKSVWALTLGARVTLGHIPSGKPENVVVISSEDAMETQIGPRLDAAGADGNRVYEVVSREAAGRTVLLPSDYDGFEALLRDLHPALVIIDPFVASLEVRLDSHKDQHVRAVLSPMALLAMELRIAMLPIVHLNKAPSGEAYLRVGNSVGFWNAARSVIMVVDDPESEDDDHRIVFQAKPNYARVGYPERWRFETVRLPGTDPETGEPIEAPRFTFVEEAWELDPADLLSPKKPRRAPSLEEAMELLRLALAEGPALSAELRTTAAEADISAATLYRAADALGVVRPKGHGEEGAVWRLP